MVQTWFQLCTPEYYTNSSAFSPVNTIVAQFFNSSGKDCLRHYCPFHCYKFPRPFQQDWFDLRSLFSWQCSQHFLPLPSFALLLCLKISLRTTSSPNTSWTHLSPFCVAWLLFSLLAIYYFDYVYVILFTNFNKY